MGGLAPDVSAPADTGWPPDMHAHPRASMIGGAIIENSSAEITSKAEICLLTGKGLINRISAI